VAELGIHLGVLIGLALDGVFEAFRGRHGLVGEQQFGVAKRVEDFLRGGVLEYLGGGFVADLAALARKPQVLDVGHRFAGKGRFKVLDRG
jgi:hypothetical protein